LRSAVPLENNRQWQFVWQSFSCGQNVSHPDNNPWIITCWSSVNFSVNLKYHNYAMLKYCPIRKTPNVVCSRFHLPYHLDLSIWKKNLPSSIQ
jgi:hypothetical protein